MTRRPSPRLLSATVLVVAGTLAGIGFGRPELVIAAAPAGVVVIVGLVLDRPPGLRWHVTLHRPRALEGDTVLVDVTVVGQHPAELAITLRVPAGLTAQHLVVEHGGGTAREDRAGDNAVVLSVRPHHAYRLSYDLRCERWGAYQLGAVRVTARTGLGLFEHTQWSAAGLPLRVFPPPTTLRDLLRPVETQLHSGNLLSRHRGDGIEFAGLRPFQSGDELRRINWRVTARRGGLWVSDRHPERNGDVILVVDTLSDVGTDDAGTLDLAVRAAAGLAAAHLGRRDRVGLIAFGSSLQWLRPGMGDRQRYRVLDTLLAGRARTSGLWFGVRAVPPGALPPEALVVGLSPLVDERVVGAFAELRGRGFDLAIVEVDPAPHVPTPARREEALARRLWLLQRDAVRQRFARAGVPVVTWDPRQPFSATVVAMEGFRRAASRARTVA